MLTELTRNILSLDKAVQWQAYLESRNSTAPILERVGGASKHRVPEEKTHFQKIRKGRWILRMFPITTGFNSTIIISSISIKTWREKNMGMIVLFKECETIQYIVCILYNVYIHCSPTPPSP